MDMNVTVCKYSKYVDQRPERETYERYMNINYTYINTYYVCYDVKDYSL